MNKLHLIFFFNIVSITFLSWISYHGNEVGNHNIYLNNNYLNCNTWKLRNDRLLTNDDPKSEIGQSGTSDNITLPGEQNISKDITGSSNIHEKVKKDIANSMNAYIKKLEHGYPNKKGLKRLDCHYEKKLFNEMYKLDKIAGHIKSKNNYFKKVIFKRYGLRFFIFLIVILFGISMSIMCCFPSGGGKCSQLNPAGNETGSTCKYMESALLVTNGIVFIPLIIVFISYIIYIMSKVRKYRRLIRKYGK
ncbi:hypothetical protein PVIIG_03767 [Plasmodium vivax India VII]|uniref:Variable surface protein Vir35 n=1 Tax=Plasmodium vivax India VII TaxID=1077284 RepID=A0A0J9SH93_PLAVI|nr:hypothetical protein PVIIG_03767 [Plasmodium vivax India VII]